MQPHHPTLEDDESGADRKRCVRDTFGGKAGVMAGPTDEEVLAFVVRWLPYGGPAPSDIFVQFGMSVGQFKRLLAAVIDSADGAGTVADHRVAMMDYLRRPSQVHDVRWGQ
jgi:hypothetical protein